MLSDNLMLVFRYWGFDGGPVLSVWLALDDSLEDNGALQVIPGMNTVSVYMQDGSCHFVWSVTCLN